MCFPRLLEHSVNPIAVVPPLRKKTFRYTEKVGKYHYLNYEILSFIFKGHCHHWLRDGWLTENDGRAMFGEVSWMQENVVADGDIVCGRWGGVRGNTQIEIKRLTIGDSCSWGNWQIFFFWCPRLSPHSF